VEEKEDSSDVPLLGAILPATKDLKIDWRLSGKVSPVSNQGKTCNSCYAFAAIADI
jgi:C1A family cysteine protease